MEETTTSRATIHSELLARYDKIRAHTDRLCQPLKTEDFVVQPVVDVSPPKWHMAHTTWFFEEFFLAAKLRGYTRSHQRYVFLFNSYYEAVGERVLRPNRGNLSRPTVEEIRAYRSHVDQNMRTLIPNLEATDLDLLQLGLNHEQQHQELLLTDIKFILGHNPLFPPYHEEFTEGSNLAGNDGFTILDSGNYWIGHQGTEFCFDNECQRHQVYLQKFQIQSRLVTNGEFLEFVNAGGYRSSQYWHSDGWTWVKETEAACPLYWHFIEGRWYRYALSGLEIINEDDPITHVNFYEAAAYAEWRGMRLPTEFEWEAASDHFQWGQRWEHTNSAYLPYPGFLRAEGAIGEYNGKFMVNQMVLRGASIATPEGHSRKTYRNFFHPHLQWQFTGIRLCKK